MLVCPLAFCFYNISSITLGLTYFNELEQLSWTDVACICMGTALLLCGVWIISLRRSPYKDDEVGEEEDVTLWGPGWHDPAAWHENALVEGAAVSPLAGPLYSGALEAERTSPRHASGSSHALPHIAHNAPLGPRVVPRPQRSVSLPFGTERPTISLDLSLIHI